VLSHHKFVGGADELATSPVYIASRSGNPWGRAIMSVMKVVGRKTARLVAGRIVQDIGDEGLSRLPSEAELLERYEVSRPSLREALRILEMYGVISIRPGPGGGTRVNQVASSQFASASSLYFHLLGLTLRNVLNTRLQVEPLMARLASERVKSGVAWDPDGVDGSGVNEESGSFHFSVARFTGDPILLLFADGLRSIYVDESADEKIPREELPVSQTPSRVVIPKKLSASCVIIFGVMSTRWRRIVPRCWTR
jgi:DNA-binding FadR family transcriptional regulator